METEQNSQETRIVEQTDPVISPWKQVTPFSKYLAMGLFIVLPFVGFWIGLHYGENKDQSIIDIGITPASETKTDIVTEERLPEKVTEESESDEIEEKEPIDVDGHILLIRDGDVWRAEGGGSDSVKLIDRDTVKTVARSRTTGQIAYTQDAPQNLYLASDIGTDSIFVQGRVAHWGWVPNSNLLWYEIESPVPAEAWPGVLGDGNIWVYNTVTGVRTKLITIDTTNSISQVGGTLSWSPNGMLAWYKVYNGEDDALHVFDRQSLESRSLFTLPYVGGNRGGPQPIPFFQWSPDSTAIYTVFTPYSAGDFGQSTREIELEHRTLAALRIPADGSPISRVAPAVRTPSLMNAETFPRAHYSDDMRYVFYERCQEDSSGSCAMDHSVFVVRDTQTNEESILVNSPKTIARQVDYGAPLTWIKDDSVFTINKGREGVEFLKYDLSTDTKIVITSVPFTSPLIWNTHFEPVSESLYFHSDTTLYILNKNGLDVVAENVEFGWQNAIDFN